MRQAEPLAGGESGGRVLARYGRRARPGARERSNRFSSSVFIFGKAKVRRRWPDIVADARQGAWARLLETPPPLARRLEILEDRLAPVVVAPDDGEIGRLDQPPLDRSVILHRPVPVEMIRRQIEQHADARVERGREIDLEARTFDDISALGRARATAAPGRGSASRYCRPSARRTPPRAGYGRSSAVVVLLPLVPVMATSGAPGAMDRALAAEQFDVADDLDARRCAMATVQCGSGWVSGTPGARTSAAKRDQSGADADRTSDSPSPSASALSRAARRIVPGAHQGAAGEQGPGGGQAGAAETEQRDGLAGE